MAVSVNTTPPSLLMEILSPDSQRNRSVFMKNPTSPVNPRTSTAYGKSKLEPGKESNLQLILGKLEMIQKEDRKALKKLKSENLKLAKKLEAEKLPARGVESMFRLTARNQINLSSIADNKANILISINSIVLTVLVSIGIGMISDNPIRCASRTAL